MNKYPLIIFVVLFICGIVISNYLEVEIELYFFAWSFLLVVAILFFLLKTNSEILTYLLFINIVLAGGIYSNLMSERTHYPFDKYKYKKSKINCEINKIELLRDDRIVLEIEADTITTNEFNIKSKINILFNLIEDDKSKMRSFYNRLRIGDKLIVEGNLQKGKEIRNPGEFDYQSYLESRGISALFYCYDLNKIKLIPQNRKYFSNIIFCIRSSIDKHIKKYNNKRSASLLRGLLLADRSEIEYETRQSFVNSGVIHVLAVSGLHVGFIILIFLFLFNRLNIILRYVLTIAGLLIFLVITGSPPSVFRAAIMAVILILSFLTNRSYNSINAIALAAFIILLLNPSEIFNPGFQLSFSAVLSILILYPVFQKSINRIQIENKAIKYLLLFSAVSIAAQVGTIPFTLYYFNKLSVIALLTNIVVIPVIGFIVGIGIFTLAVSFISSWLAQIYAASNDFLIEWLFKFVNWTGDLDFSYLAITDFSIYDSIVFYFFISILYFSSRRFSGSKSKIILIFLILINFTLFVSLDNRKNFTENKLTIVMIDVGQGDAIFINFPNMKTALIDAGNRTPYFDSGDRIVKPLLQYLGIRKIDYGFVSHLDSDHYGGFYSLIKNGFIKTIYKSALDSTLKKDINFERVLKNHEVEINYYKKEILEIGNCRLYILNNTDDKIYKSLNINDKSGIFKLVFGDTDILFTGDAGKKAEKILLNNYGQFLDSDILKLGHHGSKTSTSDIFLDAVDPEWGLISAGIDNKFNHPSNEVLERLNFRKITTKRTDKEGAIIIESDGFNFDFVDWKNN